MNQIQRLFLHAFHSSPQLVVDEILRVYEAAQVVMIVHYVALWHKQTLSPSVISHRRLSMAMRALGSTNWQLVDAHRRRLELDARNGVRVRHGTSDAVLQPAAGARRLHTPTDIRPRRAHLSLGTRVLACLPTVDVEVLEIRSRAINFVFCAQIMLGDEISRTRVATLVFHDVWQAILEPAVPARTLDSGLDPGIGLTMGFAATSVPAHERGGRIEISVVVTR